MGITGTWDGFVAGTKDVYKRGTFGSGYSINNFSVYHTSSYSGTCTKTAESSSVKVYCKNNDKSSRTFSYGAEFKSINFTPYSKLYVSAILSHGSIHIHNSSGTVISSINTDYSGTEQTFSFDLSSINITGYIDFRRSNSFGKSSTSDSYDSFNITQIYFT